jgi:general stress protein 26
MTTHDDTPPEVTRQLENLVAAGTILMVGTPSGDHGELEFRPLTAAAVDDEEIDFLIDSRQEWVGRFDPFQMVDLVLSDTRSNDWAHLRGAGELTSDIGLIDALWSPAASAYFEDGRETAGLAVLRVSITAGHYWSSPSGRIGSALSLLRAALGRNGGGEHGDVDVR